MLTNGVSIKPLKVKLLAGEQKAIKITHTQSSTDAMVPQDGTQRAADVYKRFKGWRSSLSFQERVPWPNPLKANRVDRLVSHG